MRFCLMQGPMEGSAEVNLEAFRFCRNLSSNDKAERDRTLEILQEYLRVNHESLSDDGELKLFVPPLPYSSSASPLHIIAHFCSQPSLTAQSPFHNYRSRSLFQ